MAVQPVRASPTASAGAAERPIMLRIRRPRRPRATVEVGSVVLAPMMFLVVVFSVVVLVPVGVHAPTVGSRRMSPLCGYYDFSVTVRWLWEGAPAMRRMVIMLSL